MCMYSSDGNKIILTDIRPFKLSHFGPFFILIGMEFV